MIDDGSVRDYHGTEAVIGEVRCTLTERADWVTEEFLPHQNGVEESDAVQREGAEVETNQDRSLQTLDGIGPTYEERLHDAGITTLAQLAAAEPAPLADRLGISVSRVASWIEQADQLASYPTISLYTPPSVRINPRTPLM